MHLANASIAPFEEAQGLIFVNPITPTPDEVNITLNKNSIPNEPLSPFVTSGVRIGTAAITTRGFVKEDMDAIAECLYLVASDFEKNKETVKAKVKQLTDQYPLYE